MAGLLQGRGLEFRWENEALQDPQRRIHLLLWAFFGLGLVLRIANLNHAPDQNELALVPGSTWSEIWWSLESGQNPPLHRLLVTTLAPAGLEVVLGRALSFAGSILSFYLAWKLLRPRGEIPALVAVALVATSPAAVEAGTMYRSYGLWLPLALVHLDALQRGKLVQLGVAAVLIVHLHYTAPLYLLFLGGGWALATGNRKLLLAHFPAVISLLPLLPFIFGDAPLRTRGGAGYLPGSLVQLLSGGTWIGLPLLAGLAWTLWRSGDRKPLLPLVSAGAMTLIVTPLALLTRSATTFALPGLLLLVASCWIQAPPNRPSRYVTYIFIFIQLLFCFLLIGETTLADGAASLATRLRSQPSSEQVWVYPPHAIPALGWALLGHMPEPPVCPSPTPCLTVGDLHLSGYVPGRVATPPVLFVLGSDQSLCAKELERGRGWRQCQPAGSKRVPE